jgi:hypothetical protein
VHESSMSGSQINSDIRSSSLDVARDDGNFGRTS